MRPHRQSPPPTPTAEGELEPVPTLLFKPRVVRILGLLAGLALLALFAGPPIYQRLKTWRAHAIVAAAEKDLDGRNWIEAMKKAQAAYQLSPGDYRTLRLVARLESGQNLRDALEFYRQLLATGQATAQDRRDFGEFALAHREMAAASDQLQWLLANDPNTPATLRLAAEFYVIKEDGLRAKDYCRKALAMEPGNQSLKLMLARLLAASGEVVDEIEGRRIMHELANANDAASLEALRLLARMPDLPRDDAEETMKRLEKHPLGHTEDRLLAESLRLGWHPEIRASIIANVVGTYSKAEPEDLVFVGRWLNRQSEYARTLDILNEETAFKGQDLLLVRLDALAALGRWQEVSRILDQPRVPLEPIMLDLFKARSAKELGHSDEAELAWRRVHLGASDQPNVWLYVAQYAERVGDFSEASKAWRRLVNDRDYSHLAYTALIRLAEQEGNTTALREIMREMQKAFPRDQEPRNDFAYLNLLLNEDVDKAKQASQEMYKEHPNFLAYRTTLALANLRLNDVVAARELYDGLDLDWGTVLPGWQAVRVAVLGASGRTNLAKVAAQRIPLSRLKPEERKLIEPYL